MVRSIKKRLSSVGTARNAASNPDKENDKRQKVDTSLENNPLCKLVMNCGFKFPEAKDEPNELQVDQAIFQQKLSSAFKKGRDNHVASAVAGLEELWNDNHRFCHSILPTVTSDDCCNSSRGKKQDSLIHILLGVEALQPQIVNAVLEKLPDINMNSELKKIAMSMDDLDLVHRLVSQLRWQDKIVDSKELMAKVFEIISVADSPVQKELISCIPDFVEDADHMDCASQLSNLLMENSHLVSSVVDALNNLNLKGDVLEKIQDTVLKILDSADIVDLPLVVRFLQQSLTDVNKAFEIISTLRQKLDFKSIVIPQLSSTQRNGCGSGPSSNGTKTDESIIFDVIKTGMKFQKILGDSWVKVVESLSKNQDHKVIDVFVVLVLHSMKTRRKTVETLIRNKVKSAVFTEEVITAAFNSYPQIFNEHIKEILILAEILLRSPEIVISNYGCNIYKQAFSSFDLYSQQEVIGALVTHIGSGYGPEVEAAFLALNSLVNSHTSKMASFIIFLKGILDYIDNLSVAQMRQLFSMISKLCFAMGDGTSENVLNDDMYVIIRKQLASATLKYKRIGIIGSVIIVGNMASKKLDVDFTRSLPGGDAPCKSLTDDTLKRIIEILSMVKGSVKDKPEACSIFYEELGNVLESGDIDAQVMTWVQENVIAEFSDVYLIETDAVRKNNDPQIGLAYDLDETEEAGIAVNILPMLLSDLGTESTQPTSSKASPHGKNKLICLPALFRLLRICEQQQNEGSLEGIDALLGCPLVLFGEEALNKFVSMKEEDRFVVCSSLFYAVNWLRETLNAFCAEKVDTDTRAKIIFRCKTLSSLSKTLEKCLASTSGFEVPIADYTIDDKLVEDIKPLKKILDGGKQPKKNVKKGKPKGKAKASADATAAPVPATSPNSEATTVPLENNSDSDDNVVIDAFNELSPVSLFMFPASVRQLDLQVFHALSYDAVDKKNMDAELHTTSKEEVKLEPAEMTFLLQDLLNKLNHSLLPETRRSTLKVSVLKLVGFSHLPSDIKVISFMIKLLPSLWSHLQMCITYFKDRSENCDGEVDETLREQLRDYSILYQLLVECMLTLLHWEGFRHGRNQKLLKMLLNGMLEKESTTLSSSMSTLPSLVMATVEQLIVSEMHIPNIHIAVTLLKLLTKLSEWCEPTKITTKMREMILRVLKRSWLDSEGQKEKGSKFNDSLVWLLSRYIELSKAPFSAIEEFCDGPIAELRECQTSGEEGTSTFPCLNRSSFTAMYKCMFEELIKFTKAEFTGKVQSIGVNEINDRLDQMQKSLQLFQVLNSVVKELDSRANIIVLLKNARVYLEVFLKSIMPVLDRTFRTHKDTAHAILKISQQSTRSLQHLCGHSKFSKDVSMTAHVPALKKCLETFVFRVKAMLAYNNCDAAFWLGNLKNRDLKGNEILSQVPADQSASEDDEDEVESRQGENEEEMEDDDEEEEELNPANSDSF